MMQRDRSPSYSSSVAPPPSYYPSSEAPTYSSEPSQSEQRLDFAGRRGRLLPAGRLLKRCRRISLILENQDESASIPTYGRRASISGEIQVKSRDDAKVVSVVIKLDGKISVTVGEGFHSSTGILSENFVLWENDSACSRTCPYIFPFDVSMPHECTYGNSTPPCPPSYDVAFRGVPGLFAKCVYTLTVTVTERTGGLIKRRKHYSLSTPIAYYPRSRPHQPILPPHMSFRTTLKSAPEEWTQVISQMSSRSTSNIEPLDCHLFIPSVQIYGLEDTIPFYLQLRGTVASLHAFLHPASPPSSASHFDFTSLPSLIPSKSDAMHKPTIRVFLYRQVTVVVRGQKAWRTVVLGEGKLREVRPEEGWNDGQSSLDWEGEVRCKEDVSVGGFRVGPIVVKDFIVLSLVPPSPETSPLIEHQHARPIRLVTDSFIEMVGPTPEGIMS